MMWVLGCWGVVFVRELQETTRCRIVSVVG